MTAILNPPLKTNSSLATPSSADIPTEPIWRISVEHYHEMLDAGILRSGDPVELLEGWLVLKMAKHPPHVVAGRLLRKVIEPLLPEEWDICLQDPITLEDSEPEPDLVLVRGGPREFSNRHPRPHEIGLLVEVAEASLSRDRNFKKRIYARAGIVEYWIVNVPGQRVEVYTDPTGPAESPDYRQQQLFDVGQSVPLRLDGREIGQIAVADVLP